ncbi:MAG: NAD(P)-dependent oxidoreductase [Sphingomonadaceae bacterium]|nr:NAD(P)-dependent oxidoreductase [Sphingomonadaceae bacterium]
MASGGNPHVGFVGIGNQGGPIVERIAAAGFPVTIWARTPEAAAPLVALGATAAREVTGLGACDIVGICVRDDAGVVQVFDGLFPALRPQMIVMILATIHPDTCAALAVRAAERQVTVIDTPVSGGAEVARAGKLTVMAGGPADAIERCRPVIDSFSALLVHLGDVGSGQLAKLINNTLLTAHLALADEALCSGEALGLNRVGLATLLSASSGRSYGVDIVSRLPSPAAFSSGAKLLEKDVGLLEAVAQERRVNVDRMIGTAGSFLAAAISKSEGEES